LTRNKRVAGTGKRRALSLTITSSGYWNMRRLLKKSAKEGKKKETRKDLNVKTGARITLDESEKKGLCGKKRKLNSSRLTVRRNWRELGTPMEICRKKEANRSRKSMTRGDEKLGSHRRGATEGSLVKNSMRKRDSGERRGGRRKSQVKRRNGEGTTLAQDDAIMNPFHGRESTSWEKYHWLLPSWLKGGFLKGRAGAGKIGAEKSSAGGSGTNGERERSFWESERA